jgi:AcrR family transcriptional regulator
MPRKRGLDRSVLVGEAAALADERGLDFVTLANLAERLNVRAPSLYNHIASAEHLQNQLTLFALRALRDELARAAIGRNGADGVLAIAQAYRTFAKEHPGMYGATLRAPRPDDPALQQIAGEVLDIVRAILTPFHLSEDMTIHAIRGFRSVVHGFVSLEAGGAFGLAQSIDESFHFVMQSFLAGLAYANGARG